MNVGSSYPGLIRPYIMSLFLVATIVGVAGAAVRLQATPKRPDIVVGTINGEPLTMTRFEREVRLQELKFEIGSKTDGSVCQPALLNRMIGDILIIQAASSAGLEIDERAVRIEIDSILGRNRLTRRGMSELLAAHGLKWFVFEGSVRDYVTLNRFMEEVLLADVPPRERKEWMASWLGEQYENADLDFEDSFLDTVNESPCSSEIGSVLS